MANNKRVAVIGAGAAGLVASKILSTACEVHIFESSDRLGGHIRPMATDRHYPASMVDTAFLGFKPDVYPKLSNLLAELDIPIQAMDIFGSVHLEKKNRHYFRDHGIPCIDGMDSASLAKEYRRFLASLSRASRPPFDAHATTIRQYLLDSNVSSDFIDDIVMPDVSSIWGIQPSEAEAMSVAGAIGSLLTVGKGVHILENTSSLYLQRLVDSVQKPSITLRAQVSDISPTPDKKLSLTVQGARQEFDAVVLACPADRAYSLLDDPLKVRFQDLGDVNYTDTVAILHTDPSVIANLKSRPGHFNYLDDQDGASVTWDYGLIYGNRLPRPAFLTVGATSLVDSNKIARDAIVDIARHRHCVHTVQSSVAARKLEAVSGTANVYLCGSYMGMAPVHEAAIASGIKAAQAVLEKWA